MVVLVVVVVVVNNKLLGTWQGYWGLLGGTYWGTRRGGQGTSYWGKGRLVVTIVVN